MLGMKPSHLAAEVLRSRSAVMPIVWLGLFSVFFGGFSLLTSCPDNELRPVGVFTVEPRFNGRQCDLIGPPSRVFPGGDTPTTPEARGSKANGVNEVDEGAGQEEEQASVSELAIAGMTLHQLIHDHFTDLFRWVHA